MSLLGRVRRVAAVALWSTISLAAVPLDAQPTAGQPVAAAPKPARPLQAGTKRYRASLAAAGQALDLDMTLSIEPSGDGWKVTESVTTPAGPAVDTAMLAKDSLALQSRALTQGPISIEYRVDGGKVVGEMKVPNQTVPIAIDLAGASLFADGPGSAAIVATLPLAEGYRATFSVIDVQQLRVAAASIEVAGSERVEVPAGSFDAFKVNLTSPLASGTLWVAKDTHVTVKSVANVPASGAMVTTELLE
jgi:hypothetical protein